MHRTASPLLLSCVLLISASAAGRAQPARAAAPAASPAASLERAMKMAGEGRCAEALPIFQRSLRAAANGELKRRAGAAAVRCGLALDQRGEVASTLALLQQAFPHDPEILYLATHAYSDLSMRASRELLRTAPGSPQVHMLGAESFETQGKWNEALGEYRRALEQQPDMSGIHFRIGRIILSQPATPTTAQDARREFEAELKIDPSNAGAEYVLGELAREAGQLPEAIGHFTRATRLDPSFTDAFLGLGRALLDANRAAEAVAPLETCARQQPENPTLHFTLATAYQRLGRKEDAAREFAAHKATAEKARQAEESVRRAVSGGPPQ
ncbi:MAG TPA: tetratricopeptide repeat protein [Bryobacteraceae bacterium]|nr:tetratricopeptide repeat protein [Bryobacteraceae bacterium]